MSWFQGTINEAVQLVNAKGCIFTVFIRDDTEPSNQLDELLNDTKVQDILQQHVSIKLALDSENARMFGQFYPIQRVPMVYFIKQGVIKDFAIESTTVDEIIDKMDRLCQSDSPSSSVPASSTSSLSTDNVSDVNAFTTTATQNPNSSAPSSPSVEGTAADLDKKAKLKQQMEQARAKRDELEKQNEKQREIKRRQDGQEAQSTQQQLQDQQNKIYFAKIKQEKQADEAHRRKIKEQIARDREEKLAERQRRVQETTAEPAASSQRKDTRQHDVCHLNVRQGDGNNMRNTFNAQDTLAEVRTWIDTHRTDGDQPYKLLAQFPTRHFTTGDEQKTVEALDLVPSGTLIMKPIRNVASAYHTSDDAASYGGMLADYMYSAGGMVYTTLTGVVTRLGSMVGAVASPGGSSNGHRLGGPQASGSRQINGINTLQQDQADDDDRKKTYNGNSVNQE